MAAGNMEFQGPKKPRQQTFSAQEHGCPAFAGLVSLKRHVTEAQRREGRSGSSHNCDPVPAGERRRGAAGRPICQRPAAAGEARRLWGCHRDASLVSLCKRLPDKKG